MKNKNLKTDRKSVRLAGEIVEIVDETIADTGMDWSGVLYTALVKYISSGQLKIDAAAGARFK